jgi:branched-chain amino acid aminotransferase
MTIASLDGVIAAAADTRVPATDEGLLRGDGAFEVIRVYEGRPFALDAHMRRLERSAANLRLELDIERVQAEIGALLEAASQHDGLLRVVVTRGGRRLLLTEPLPALPPTMRLAYVTYAPTRVLDGVKSLSYAGNMLASRLARERGFDEALLVTPHGRVLEAPTSSFFWVRDGALYTPPLDDHILASITRALVIELAGAVEAPCSADDVAAADEAFLASTVREVLPVAGVEEHELPVNGPITAEAGRLVRDRIADVLAAA